MIILDNHSYHNATDSARYVQICLYFDILLL